MLDLIRVATLVLGSFALGLTVTVLVLYTRSHRLGLKRAHGVAYRIPIIGMAHALLIGIIDGEILQHVADDEPFAWWLSPAASIAFALSIWALVEMLRSPEVRGLAQDVQAHGQYPSPS